MHKKNLFVVVFGKIIKIKEDGYIKEEKKLLSVALHIQKNLHGLHYCHICGIKKVSEPCLITAAVQNMKNITRVLTHM